MRGTEDKSLDWRAKVLFLTVFDYSGQPMRKLVLITVVESFFNIF